jgi:AraC-like DNA-binding protein
MEFINHYINISINNNNNVSNSYCKALKDAHYVYLEFGLFANDCLFDLAEANYIFNIKINNSYFEKYAESLDINIEQQAICCNTQAKLLELVNCKLEGVHRKLFFESVILFLLYQSQKSNLLFPVNCNSCAVLNKPIEVDKIHQAQKYILANLALNITIPIIAQHVGTNQCYLKKGFKEIFKQTIFEYIQENRMAKAKHLLQATQVNISQVANQVGYASLSSFSLAYKNYYGISPMEYAKASSN